MSFKTSAEQGQFFLAENIPHNLTFDFIRGMPSIKKSLIELIKSAQYSIDISSGSTENPEDNETCQQIFYEFQKALERGVFVRYISPKELNEENQGKYKILQKDFPKLFSVGYLDMWKLTLKCNGKPKANLMVVDKKSFYVGSSNCDWENFVENVDIGVFGMNTKTAANDLSSIFQSFWDMAALNKPLDEPWPKAYDTKFNDQNAFVVGEELVSGFFSVSPPNFKTKGRIIDSVACAGIISNQKSGILRISCFSFNNHEHRKKTEQIFWGKLDFTIRKATMERNLNVNIMVDSSALEDKMVMDTLSSLHLYNKIRVKKVSLPLSETTERKQIFNSKLCIGDSSVWISSNDLTHDDFYGCTGAGCVVLGNNPSTKNFLVETINYFDRYFNSTYATYINELENSVVSEENNIPKNSYH